MASTPNFASADLLATAALAVTANPNHDGTTGTYSTLFTGTNGLTQRIDAISINVAATAGVTTAGKIRFFISTDGGTTKRKLGELNVTAATPSASVAAFSDVWFPPRPLAVGDANTIIYATTHNAEAFVAQVYGSKF
jgi:hypothetical protein